MQHLQRRPNWPIGAAGSSCEVKSQVSSWFVEYNTIWNHISPLSLYPLIFRLKGINTSLEVNSLSSCCFPLVVYTPQPNNRSTLVGPLFLCGSKVARQAWVKMVPSLPSCPYGTHVPVWDLYGSHAMFMLAENVAVNSFDYRKTIDLRLGQSIRSAAFGWRSIKASWPHNGWTVAVIRSKLLSNM